MIADLHSEDVSLGLVTQTIEDQGMLVDKSRLTNYKVKLRREEDETLTFLRKHLGTDFNPSSPPQTASGLEKLGLLLPKKKDTGNPDTSELSLRKTSRLYSPELREVVDKILRVRGIRKLVSTYIDGFLQRMSYEGYLYSRFRFPGTVTWRLSSSDPNLQNLPHGEFREAFIAPPGFVLCEADYSQVELRIAAAVANEVALIEVFKAGGDPHGMLGRKIFKVGLAEVLSYERRHRAKTTNFGLLYGAGAFTLSDQFLKKGDYVSVAECRIYHSVFWDTYKALRGYMDMQTGILESGGFVVSPVGGYSWCLDDMLLAHHGKRRDALLAGCNAPIQSVAPRLTLRAARNAQHQGIRIVGQVHDSLVAYLPEATARRDALRLRQIMEEEGQEDWWGDVPCVADVAIGPNWNQLEAVA